MIEAKKRIAVIGHFGFGKDLLNGQTVKTKIVTNQIAEDFGEEQILKFDTHGGIKFLFKLPFQIIKALRNCKNILIFPAHNGLKVITPLLSLFNIFYKRSLHYCVIGGWMPNLVSKKKCLKKQLMRFKGIYVETSTMEKALVKQGFKNVVVMPNCKKLDILNKNEIVLFKKEPYHLCTFSRVMKEKGIEHAVEIVKKINNENGRVIFTLDIYGQIDSQQAVWFDNLKKSFPDGINYCGTIPFDKSVNVLKNYFALIFPTLFYTEGIPGTIIDAYAAGIPVISSKWESFNDVIDDGITGIGYEFGSMDGLYDAIKSILQRDIFTFKTSCLNKAKFFLPSTVLSETLYKNL